MLFRTAFLYAVVTLIFRGQKRGDFSDIVEENDVVTDFEGCESNPFAQGIFRPMVAYLQILSKIGKKCLPI